MLDNKITIKINILMKLNRKRLIDISPTATPTTTYIHSLSHFQRHLSLNAMPNVTTKGKGAGVVL